MAEESFSSAVTNAGGRRAGAAPSGEDQAAAATRPFEVVEFDGHKLHVRLTVKMTDPLGYERLLELHRIWILVLLDVNTRAVLGYSLALGKEYNKDDVAAALQSALKPFVPRQYTIPDLQIVDGGRAFHRMCSLKRLTPAGIGSDSMARNRTSPWPLFTV
jgi:putative transposase